MRHAKDLLPPVLWPILSAARRNVRALIRSGGTVAAVERRLAHARLRVAEAPLDPEGHRRLAAILSKTGTETTLLSAVAELRASLWLGRTGPAESALREVLRACGLPAEPFLGAPASGPLMPDGWTDQERLLAMSVDHYQSFMRIAERLASAGCEAGDSVIDVGGSDGASGMFMPHVRYMVVDPETNGLSALPIPLPDRFADYVVTNDTLEHIPGPLRPQFLAELVRVSCRAVCVQGPFVPPNPQRAIEPGFYRAFPNRWTEEHLANGLPSVEETDRILGELPVSFARTGFGDLGSQFWMLACSWMWQFVRSEDARLSFNSFSNSRYRQLDNALDPVGYCYLIRPSQAEGLPR